MYPIAPEPEALTNQRPPWTAEQWSLGDAVIGNLFSAYLAEEVFDSEHDVNDLMFNLLSGPNWLFIDSQGHLIGGGQSSKDLEAHKVMLRVSDPDGFIAK